jgi:hypothetical protein
MVFRRNKLGWLLYNTARENFVFSNLFLMDRNLLFDKISIAILNVRD